MEQTRSTVGTTCAEEAELLQDRITEAINDHGEGRITAEVFGAMLSGFTVILQLIVVEIQYRELETSLGRTVGSWGSMPLT